MDMWWSLSLCHCPHAHLLNTDWMLGLRHCRPYFSVATFKVLNFKVTGTRGRVAFSCSLVPVNIPVDLLLPGD